MILVYPPKFCTTIFFDFFRGECYAQEKLGTMVMQNVLGETKCIFTTPAIFARALGVRGQNRDVTWYCRGQTSDKICQYE